MLTIRALILFCFSSIFSTCFAASPTLITLDKDDYDDYHAFVNGRVISSIEDFNHPRARRDVVEFILLQQALYLGGMAIEPRFIQGSYYARNIKLLQQGKIALGSESVWMHDLTAIKEDVYISDSIIDKGEYFAGIYTSPNNTEVLAISQSNQLNNLTAVSNSNWGGDWMTLSNLPLKKLHNERLSDSMAKMVSLEMVDFLLMPFQSTEDMSYTLRGSDQKLYPVPNIKVLLNDSRHWVVSKKFPQGEALFKALNIGLAKLKQQGKVKKAHMEIGFIHSKTTHWKIINPYQ